jgi:hypothetical protein
MGGVQTNPLTSTHDAEASGYLPEPDDKSPLTFLKDFFNAS